MVKKSRILIVDVETTGANPFLHDLLSVAIVPYSVDHPHLNIYVKTDLHTRWSEYGRKNFEKFRGVWEENALSKLEAHAAIQQYLSALEFDEPAILAGHNVAFDRMFLTKLSHDIGQYWFEGLSHRTLDTFSLIFQLVVNGKAPDTALPSDGALEYFNIKVDPSIRHTAIGDAWATRELLMSIFDKSIDECGVRLPKQ